MNLTLSVLQKARLTNAMNFEPKFPSPKYETAELSLVPWPLSGNPYDGHTVEAVLKQLKRITGTQPDIMIADRRYRGEKDFGTTQLLTPSQPTQDDTEYKNVNKEKDSEKELV